MSYDDVPTYKAIVEEACQYGKSVGVEVLLGIEAEIHPDQEAMQRIIAEGGVEGLQNFLNEQGGGHQVMTAGDLKKKQEDLKRMRAEMEAEARFEGEL